MNRLTTDKPVNNIQMMLNFSYCDNGRATLLFADGNEHVDLCEYIAKQSIMCGCDLKSDDVMAGACVDGCDCILSVLYTVAVQAAELRARLKQYEDIGLMPDEVREIVESTLTPNERRQKLGLHAVNVDFENICRLNYLQGGDSSG